MRIPYTVNLPDKKKLAKGRTPALAKLVQFNDLRYPIGTFTPNAPKGGERPNGKLLQPRTSFSPASSYQQIFPDDPRLAALEDKWKQLGLNGDIDGRYSDDRSRAVMAFTTACIRAGIADDVLASCLMTWPIGQHIRDQNGGAARSLGPGRDERQALRRVDRRFPPHAPQPELLAGSQRK